MTTTDRRSVVTPADWILPARQGQWTYADYLSLPDDGNHYEIVHGVLFMAPSPSGEHQDAELEIAAHLRTYVKLAGLGVVRIAPFDVRLSPRDVLQPDIFVVLNAKRQKLQKTFLDGPPDLAIEIASPSTAGFDRREKQDTYARFVVPEYWIVDAGARTVEVLVLEEGHYRSLGVFSGKQTLPSRIISYFPVPVEQFFV